MKKQKNNPSKFSLCQRRGRPAFTLVELIVVITILAILGTIAFISLQGYAKQARDSTRISDLSTMKTSLELFQLDAGKYPLPSDGSDITYSGAIVWNQGTFGDSVFNNVEKLDKIPTDPLSERKYSYSVTAIRNQYELAGALEGDEVVFNLATQTNAGNLDGVAIVTGTYNGQIVKTLSGTTCDILTLPSITTNDLDTTDLVQIINNKGLVHHGYNNLSSSFKGSKFDEAGGFNFTPNKLVAYTDTSSCTSLTDKSDYTARVNMLKGIQDSYSGTILKGDGKLKRLLSLDIDTGTPSIDVQNFAGDFVNNVLNGKISLVADTSSENTSTSANILNSLRFNDNDSASLSKTPVGAGDRKTWTWSAWVKRTEVATSEYYMMSAGTGNSGWTDIFRFYLNQININLSTTNSSHASIITAGTYIDPSDWVHVVVKWDTTQAVDSDRFKLYVNGNEITNFSVPPVYPSQNFESLFINNSNIHKLGVMAYDNSGYMDGYMSDVHFVDGQALTPTSFGQFRSDGKWIPKTVSIPDYGTNGFALNFGSGSNLGLDSSGLGNDFTSSNLASTDQMHDSPTNNYATWNSIANWVGTLSDGNLNISHNTYDKDTFSTIGMSSGKWYWEVDVVSQGLRGAIGISDTIINYGARGVGANYAYAGLHNGLVHTSANDNGDLATFNGTHTYTFAYDADIGSLWINTNAAPDTGTTAQATGLPLTTYYVYTEEASTGGKNTHLANFGQGGQAGLTYDSAAGGSFKYTPPTGFKALSTSNLPSSPVVAKDNFNVVTYAGNSTDSASITGVGFQPDLVWIKNRTNANNHQIYDSVRGPSGGRLSSNTTDTEANLSEFTTFDSNGFTLGNWDNRQNGPYDYVAWNWKAGGDGVVNNDGSIQSMVSANTSAGFSIVGWTGNGVGGTIGHGLSKKPDLIITKGRENVYSWRTWSKGLSGPSYYIDINQTGAESDSSTVFNGQSSLNFTVGNGPDVSSNGLGFIAYVFHSVDGYSKIGSYTGNGSADGTFVYTGFKPKYLMVKRYDSTGNWVINDGVRSTYNETTDRLVANGNFIEASVAGFDFNSNGFKVRSTEADRNASGGTYIYYVVAEYPFK